MSQIIKNLASGPVPPAVATSYVTDVHDNTTAGPGTSIPALNVEKILGRDTTQDNANGIRTDSDPNNSNNLYVELTNRIHGSVTTNNTITPTTIASFNLGATPAVFTFDVQIASFNVTDTNGDGYFISGSARTDGATARLCGTPDKIVNEEVADDADANMVVSGNSVVFQATGLLFKVHNWKLVATYVEVT